MRARKLALIGLLLFGTGIRAHAAAEPQPPVAPSAAPEVPAPPQVTFADGLLSVSAKDADVRALVERIAAKSGVAIDLDKSITGKATVDFKGVEFEEGLKNVLKDVVEGGFASEYARKNNEKGQLALTKVTIARVGGQGQTDGRNAPKVETYSPEIIVEGGWGEGPGEFGVAWTYPNSLLPESPSGRVEELYPPSIAVNSRGEVYILDPVNNRIQKFTNAGTYMLSLAVEAYAGPEAPIWYGQTPGDNGKMIFDRIQEKREGKFGVDRWFPFYDPITTRGINIVIDAQDTLYYYRKKHETKLKEGNPLRYSDPKQPRPYGEVLIFRDDALVKTVKVPDVDLTYGLRTDWAGNVWVGLGDYEVREGKRKKRNMTSIGLKDGRRVEISMTPSGKDAFDVLGQSNAREKEILYAEKDGGEPWVSSTYFVTRAHEVFVYHGWHRSKPRHREAFLDRYSEMFELLSTAEVPRDEASDPQVDMLRSVLDDQGNLYSLSVTNQGVKAIKWRRK